VHSLSTSHAGSIYTPSIPSTSVPNLADQSVFPPIHPANAHGTQQMSTSSLWISSGQGDHLQPVSYPLGSCAPQTFTFSNQTNHPGVYMSSYPVPTSGANNSPFIPSTSSVIHPVVVHHAPMSHPIAPVQSDAHPVYLQANPIIHQVPMNSQSSLYVSSAQTSQNSVAPDQH